MRGTVAVLTTFFYTCYSIRAHYINVSGDRKRLLVLFIKQWLKSSRKQPLYLSFLLTPTLSLAFALPRVAVAEGSVR